jgi:hypothetical protein
MNKEENNLINNLPSIGDIFAIPLFALSSYYFYSIENKNSLEYILLIFSIAGFIADVFFVYLFYNKK